MYQSAHVVRISTSTRRCLPQTPGDAAACPARFQGAS